MSNLPETDERLPLRVLVPSADAETLEDFLCNARLLAGEPFAADRIEALGALSDALLKHPQLRRDSAAASLGFWLRRASLAGLKKDFFARGRPGVSVPAGLVFHVAPANVDTMFIYSWALSFLAGNANVVRTTSRASPLIDELMASLNALFAARPEACRGNLFVTYGHDDEITERLSAACDTRIVWGGDETVRRIRAVPLNPHAAERSFSSKRSLSAISTGAYLAADDVARSQLADRMAADMVPFSQMACSSPLALYWVGPPECGRLAMHDFDSRLQAAMASKTGAPDLGSAVRRLTFAFGAIAEGRAVELNHLPHSTHIVADSVIDAKSSEPCGNGLLVHAMAVSLEVLMQQLRQNHQTITYFGLSETERDQLARQAGRAGVDRIVPVGHALDFGPYWDGYDLWNDLTRQVVVQ
jgi:hypothetical protein